MLGRLEPVFKPDCAGERSGPERHRIGRVGDLLLNAEPNQHRKRYERPTSREGVDRSRDKTGEEENDQSSRSVVVDWGHRILVYPES